MATKPHTHCCFYFPGFKKKGEKKQYIQEEASLLKTIKLSGKNCQSYLYLILE